MQLAGKLALALAVGILAVMSGYAWVQVRREAVLLEAEAAKGVRVARALRATVEATWQMWGEEATRLLVEGADEEVSGVTIRWTVPTAAAGDPRLPALSAAERGALADGRIVRRTASGAEQRLTYIPLAVPGAVPAALELRESLEPEMAFIRSTRRAILVATLAVTGICGLIALGVGYWLVGRPMRALGRLARAVGAGDLSTRIAIRQRDEIGQLAREINGMCDALAAARRRIEDETAARIQALEQLRHADRLATVGRLASGVAHELGTPLSVISARAGMIAGGRMAPAAMTEHAHIIVAQADRIGDTVRELLDFSRRRGPQPGPVDLQELVAEAIDLLTPAAAGAGVVLERVGARASAVVEADRSQLLQVLANLMLNGIQASRRGGRLSVGVETAAPGGDPADEWVAIAVEDEGSGMAPDVLARVFEPFFTTKEAGEGTGLGLAVASGIVSDHGGRIEVESVVGRGSRFTLRLRRRATVPLEKAS